MYLCFITDPSGLVYTLGCLSTGQPALPLFRISATRTKRKPSALCDTCRLHAILRREADSVYRRRYNAEERRSEEHTSELQSLMRISYAVFCLKKKKKHNLNNKQNQK